MLTINLFLNYMIMLIFILVSVSFFTLFERKLLSYLQMRKGPNKVGLIGMFQAFSDGIKLFSNEFMNLYNINKFIYYISPIMMFLISFFMWMMFPFMFNLLNLNNYMLMMFCLLSLNVYPLMFAGIFSNSIYSMLGGMRSIAQTISYEVSFILMMFVILILMESLDLMLFFLKNFKFYFLFFPLMIIFYSSILAELNRTPFDFSEGESELISGYNIEYMSSMFALIFLGEYSNMIFMMMIFMIIFFSMMNLFLMMLLMMLLLFLLIFIRALLPRLRYDKLMFLVWLSFLPIILNYLIYIMMMKYFLLNFIF